MKKNEKNNPMNILNTFHVGGACNAICLSIMLPVHVRAKTQFRARGL